MLHVGSHEGLDPRRRIVGDHSEAHSARARIEVFGVLASRLGLIGVAIDHLDGPDDENFSGRARKRRRLRGREFPPDRLRRRPPRDRDRGDHRPTQFLRQQPSGLVSDAELILQLPRRHAVGMCRHEMRRREPRRQRQLGPTHHRSRRGRSLSTAIEAFVRVRPALQRRRALLATAGTNKTLRPTPLRQEGGATRLIGKRHLKLRKRSTLGHCAPCRGRLEQRPTAPAYHI